VWAGALAAWPGIVGLAITLASWAGLAQCYRVARGAEAVVEQALCDGLGRSYREEIFPEVREKFAPAIDWRQILLPLPVWHPGVERVRNVVYDRVDEKALALDVYRPRAEMSGCPTLLQIHGGAWILGSKNEQGIPLMRHLASRGWVCVSANYRLSPRATFPDHLIDCKRAVQWIREHGAEYGANPDFVVVTGGSAGGHLAALVALTANDPAYQPGFERADTSVAGCVAFYGVYDFTNRSGYWLHKGLTRLLERRVMKVPLASAPEAYEKASPIARITAAAPPFFVVHGTHDTMVPVAEARAFAHGLRAATGGPGAFSSSTASSGTSPTCTADISPRAAARRRPTSSPWSAHRARDERRVRRRRRARRRRGGVARPPEPRAPERGAPRDVGGDPARGRGGRRGPEHPRPRAPWPR